MPPAPGKEPRWVGSGTLASVWCSVTVLCSSCPAAQLEPASAGWMLPYQVPASRGHLWPKQQRANILHENPYKAFLKLI